MPKINKVFGSPILQNLNGKSVLDNFFLDEPKKMPSREKFYIFRKTEDGQNRKMVTKIEFTPIYLISTTTMLCHPPTNIIFQRMDPGYPRSIQTWRGIPHSFRSITSAPDGKTYIFDKQVSSFPSLRQSLSSF